jgi:phospholipase/carboxylesterase
MVIAPNAPYPCKEYPNGFDWIRFDGDWTPENIIKKLHDAEIFLNHFLDTLLATYHLPENKLALIGFSQGARLALHIALRRKRACGAVVSYSGGLSQPQLLAKEIRSTPPVCLIHGEKDDILHIDQHHNTVKILHMLDVPVTELVFPELKHRIDEMGIEEGIVFLQGVIVI